MVSISIGCSEQSAEGCVSGTTERCVCANGVDGVKTCSADGVYGVCDCSAARDAGIAPIPDARTSDPEDAGISDPASHLGEPCTLDSDCSTGLCLPTTTTGGICTAACADASGCPAGWTCEPRSDRAVCVCGDEGVETCDGTDEDCDGAVDEGGASLCAANQRCAGGICACPFERSCDGACVDTDRDVSHCGACGTVCAAGAACVAGSCACPGAGLACSGVCRDVGSDGFNCGGCGVVCPSGSSCVAGECRCPGIDGRVCAGACADVSRDAANCGSCGNECAAGGSCTGGGCACPGVDGRACSGYCRDVASDLRHCGDCGVSCPSGATCASGVCRCPVSTPDVCAGMCRSLANDTTNCGSCGNVCAIGASCASGSCICPPSAPVACAGACTDTTSNPDHCGACGTSCPFMCSIGSCDGVASLELGAADHTCVSLSSGRVACWGRNQFGQLGDGTTINRARPIVVTGISDAVEVVTSFNRTCARRASGAVACWGQNGVVGTLGDGTTTDRLTPTPVTGISDAVELSAANLSTCARRVSGSVVCWGSASNGALGNGSTGVRLTPGAAVSDLTDAVELASGSVHHCARRSSGSVVCWGGNTQGQLGDGTTTERPSPVAVPGVTDAVEITAGGQHTCARRAGGTVVCWGMGSSGELGDGTQGPGRYSVVPVTVSGYSGVPVEIAAGSAHTCLRTSGTVLCFGANSGGQLGTGSTVPATIATPSLAVGLFDATALAASSSHTCALRGTGGLMCWGSNNYGNLGDGSMSTRAAPTDVTP